MTEAEQLAKIQSILSDRWFRVNNLYPLKNEAGGVEIMRLNWAQQHLHRNLWYRNKVLKVRKLGISTYAALGVILDTCIFGTNRRCAIVDATEDDAKKKLEMIRFAWLHMTDEAFPAARAVALWLQNKLGLKLTSNAKTELAWNNGSAVYADVSLRGDTPQVLHVSELGAISVDNPKRAQEIVAGSFNSVAIGNVIIDESTHKGGRFGVNYDTLRAAMATPLPPPSPAHWKFFFFSWIFDPRYRLPLPPGMRLQVSAKHAAYFALLERRFKVALTDEQKFWYVTMASQPHADMPHEFPGTQEEALAAQAEGAVYGEQMAELRAAGRVKEFASDGHAPLFTFWDLGMSDFTAIWLLQLVGRDVLALNYRTGWMETMASYAVTCHEWQQRYKLPIIRHYVPHDAGAHKSMDGKTSLDLMRECGLTNIVTVPRTPDKSVGIKHLRSLLPRFAFHAIDCDVEKMVGDRRMPSGLGAMEGYRYAPTPAGGAVKLEPVHDEASNGADALRTFSEAHLRGMMEGISETARDSRPLALRAVGVGQTRAESEQALNGATTPRLQAWAVR